MKGHVLVIDARDARDVVAFAEPRTEGEPGVEPLETDVD